MIGRPGSPLLSTARSPLLRVSFLCIGRRRERERENDARETAFEAFTFFFQLSKLAARSGRAQPRTFEPRLTSSPPPANPKQQKLDRRRRGGEHEGSQRRKGGEGGRRSSDDGCRPCRRRRRRRRPRRTSSSTSSKAQAQQALLLLRRRVQVPVPALRRALVLSSLRRKAQRGHG